MAKSIPCRSIPFLILAFAVCLLAVAGCDKGTSDTEPVYRDDGIWILDSAYTLDEFPFQAAACTEVFPEGSISADTIPSDAVDYLRIRATACYHVRVRVVNADSDTVRTLDARFGIFNRTESEKNRGVVGFLSWDGKDDQGKAAAAGEYLWRMEFDFGAGRLRKFRTVFTLP